MSQNDFVRYTSDVEQTQDGELETLAELDQMFKHIQQHVLEKTGVARRGTHAKPTGLLKGRLIVAKDLSPELVQGVFAPPGREYEVLARLSQGPSEYISDKASGQHGFALKVLGAEGPHVRESRETTTQDWVFGAQDTAFTDSTAKNFLATFKRVAAKSTWIPQAAIIAGSRLARGTEAVLETVSSGSLHLRFFGTKPSHPLTVQYFSQAAIRYGDYIAKVGAFPAEEMLKRIGDNGVDPNDDDSYQKAMREYLSANEATYDVRVQLCTNLNTMPVEDASVVWPEDQSPYRNVARLIFPGQNPLAPDRRIYFEERLSFNPVHSLEEHRALGSIMRSRAHVYVKTQDFRQSTNGMHSAEPHTLAEVPD